MRQARTAFALTLVAAALPALAAEFKPSDSTDALVRTVVTFGTTIRTAAPEPGDYGYLPSTTVAGAAPGELVGQTGGSDLNFRKGRPVSTVAQAMMDFGLHDANVGLFVRAALWHDFTLGHQAAGYGNYPDDYAAGKPLSDSGFAPAARFQGAMVRDAYLSDHVDIGNGRTLDARLGRQVLAWDSDQAIVDGNWGGVRMISGGISAATNPQDYAAQVRPGAIPEEARVPVDMISAHLASGRAWSADAFVPFETREAVLPGCGTFFDTASVVPQGCDMAAAVGAPIAGSPLATVSSLTEKGLLGNGFYVHRRADVLPSAQNQFGLAGHLAIDPFKTTLSAYVMNTPATQPFYQLQVEDVNGHVIALPASLGQVGVVAGGLLRLNPAASLPPIPALTGVVNPLEYDIVYPKSVHLFGLSFDARPTADLRVFGEAAYRPNQPVSDNLNDVLAAFLLRQPTSLIAEQKNILAIPAGGTYDAYDRLPVTTATLGFTANFLRVLGAAQARVSAEVGMSHVGRLPDTSVMRYGRAFAYGSAPYMSNGTLTPGCGTVPAGAPDAYAFVPGKTCTSDGFITPSAWGVRLLAAASYANVIPGALLSPSLLVADDVSGYSYDGTFSKGRLSVRPSLRADWARGWFAQLAYTSMSGGKYNLLSDRSNLMLAAGTRF